MVEDLQTCLGSLCTLPLYRDTVTSRTLQLTSLGFFARDPVLLGLNTEGPAASGVQLHRQMEEEARKPWCGLAPRRARASNSEFYML